MEQFGAGTILKQLGLDYIHNNPLQDKWNLYSRPEDYCFSSAAFYEKLPMQGLHEETALVVAGLVAHISFPRRFLKDGELPEVGRLVLKWVVLICIHLKDVY